MVPVVRALVEAAHREHRHAPRRSRLCVRLGASIVNDVTGFTDQATIDLAASTDGLRGGTRASYLRICHTAAP